VKKEERARRKSTRLEKMKLKVEDEDQNVPASAGEARLEGTDDEQL